MSIGVETRSRAVGLPFRRLTAAIFWLNGLIQDPTLTSKHIPGKCSHRVPRWPETLACPLPASALSFPRIPTPLLSLPPSLFLLFLRSPLPVMILVQCDIIAQSSNLPAADHLSEARHKFVDRGAQCAVRSVPRSREKRRMPSLRCRH